jgi:hypothetical protein
MELLVFLEVHEGEKVHDFPKLHSTAIRILDMILLHWRSLSLMLRPLNPAMRKGLSFG